MSCSPVNDTGDQVPVGQQHALRIPGRPTQSLASVLGKADFFFFGFGWSNPCRGGGVFGGYAGKGAG